MKKKTLSGKERVQEFRSRKKTGDMQRLEVYLPKDTIGKLDTLSREFLQERGEVIRDLIETKFKQMRK